MFKQCELCDKNFEVNQNNKRSYNRRFCSGLCAKKHNGLINKGKKHSLETRLLMSKASKGERNHFFGKHHTKKSKILIGDKNIERFKSKVKIISLTDREKEIFDGFMISDGSLNKNNVSARLTMGFKYKETVEFFIKTLSSLQFQPVNEYQNCFFTKSLSYGNLLDEYKRWYRRKKIVPKDIQLTSLFCYCWYICDGYRKDNNVIFCTDAFKKEDNLFLIRKLKKEGFDCSLTSRNRIFLKKQDSIKFLKWIKPNHNLDVYNYKFV